MTNTCIPVIHYNAICSLNPELDDSLALYPQMLYATTTDAGQLDLSNKKKNGSSSRYGALMHRQLIKHRSLFLAAILHLELWQIEAKKSCRTAVTVTEQRLEPCPQPWPLCTGWLMTVQVYSNNHLTLNHRWECPHTWGKRTENLRVSIVNPIKMSRDTTGML